MVNGTISFKDGDMVYLPKEVEMKNVGGGLRIKNSDVYINNFRFDIFNNIVILTGEMKNLVTLLTTEPDKAVINWDIYSPGLNLEPLIHLLKAKHTSAENNRKEVNDIVSGIDNMLEHGSIRVSLKTPRVVYKKFEATAVNADITFMPNRYIIHKVELDHADGHVNFNGTIDNRRDNEHEANVNATLQDADVRKIFHAFNDFGQDAIKQYNIAGRLNANIGVHLLFDDAGNPNTDSLRSMVDFSLEKGALYNFEPLKKIQSFIFKDRNLDSVKFAELRDRLTIAGHRIKIDRMEIESTALTMYVEGVYGIKGNTDITIQLPLRNLKKHDQGYQPQNQGVNNGGGLSFYIHAVSGPDGRMQFKPEFFHFLKKRKQAIH